MYKERGPESVNLRFLWRKKYLLASLPLSIHRLIPTCGYVDKNECGWCAKFMKKALEKSCYENNVDMWIKLLTKKDR